MSAAPPTGTNGHAPAAARRLAVDFRPLAASYDRFRPADADWWRLFDETVAAGDLRRRQVLEVGCGTGAFAAALTEQASAAVTAVDACEEMLAVARRRVGKRARLERAAAERLPFPARSFERAVMRLVVQELDRPLAFGEAARVLVPGGRVAIVTSHPESLDELWVNRLFPELAAIDRARFPRPEALAAELVEAGFERPAVRTLRQHACLTRAEALTKLRRRQVSTLQFLDESAYRVGLVRAAHELPDRFAYPLEWALVVAAARGRPT